MSNFKIGSLYKISLSSVNHWLSADHDSMPFTTVDLNSVRVNKHATFLCLSKFKDDARRSLAVFLTQTYKTCEPVEIRMFEESDILFLVEID
jgi:hypothetical protein